MRYCLIWNKQVILDIAQQGNCSQSTLENQWTFLIWRISNTGSANLTCVLSLISSAGSCSHLFMDLSGGGAIDFVDI